MKKTSTILAVMLMAINITKAQWNALGLNTNALNANGIIYSVVTDIHGAVYAAGAFSRGDSSRQYYVAKWTGDTAWVPLDTAGFKPEGFIYSLTTDDSGYLYAAGAFTDAGTADIGGGIFYYGHLYVAKWNGTTWTELGTNGLCPVPSLYGSAIYSIAVDHSGNVYAAGEFKDSLGKCYVAKWDGTAWSEVGTGSHALRANAYIHTIAIDPSDNIYAAGLFTDSPGYRYTSGGTLLDSSGYEYVAKWNGTSWSEMGTGANALHATSPIQAVTTDPSGNVYVGYDDTASNYYVAQWNGTNWAQVGTGSAALNANGGINTLATDAAGDLYAAGNFTDARGAQYVAKWNGTTWTELGTGNALDPNSYIISIAIDTADNVYAGGYFTDGFGFYYVAEYDPNTQDTASDGINSIRVSAGSSAYIYPNPANGQVSVGMTSDINTTATVTVTDILGRAALSADWSVASGTNTKQIYISTWAEGAYIVTITSGGTKSSAKLIISR